MLQMTPSLGVQASKTLQFAALPKVIDLVEKTVFGACRGLSRFGLGENAPQTLQMDPSLGVQASKTLQFAPGLRGSSLWRRRFLVFVGAYRVLDLARTGLRPFR